MDGTELKVPTDQWVPYNNFTQVWYNNSNNILPQLKSVIKNERPDHLFIIGIFDWQYNFKPLLFCKGVKKNISVRGMLHPGALSQKSFKKSIYLSLWKLLGLHKKNIFHASDEKEKDFIHKVFGKKAMVKVAANFPRVLSGQPAFEKEPGHLKLISIALISPMKNILLLLESLKSGDGSPESLKNRIEYNIYGPVKDKNYWMQCEELIKELPANITVNYHGDILPGKVADALSQNHVFVLPSKSENFGHSIYEALTAGLPVITSNHTPWNNLKESKAGINVSTGNIEELQKAIDHFATMSHLELGEWSNAAREYSLKAVDLEKTKKQYLEMFDLKEPGEHLKANTIPQS